MSIERVFYCDGPECERHARTVESQPAGFLTVTEDADQAAHFCGWDCLLRFAGEKPPEEVIPAEISD